MHAERKTSEQLENLISAALQAHSFKQWSEGKVTYPMYGLAHADDMAPGKSIFLRVTDSGLTPYQLTPLEDVQSGRIVSVPLLGDVAQLPAAPALPEDFRSRIRNERLNTAIRAEALHEWFQRNEAEAASYLVAELVRADSQEDWRNTLVFIAEEVQFADPAVQRTVCEKLLEIAASLRTSQKAESDQVVWSALRRAATLLDPTELSKLLPFLEAGPAIDTRLVALQAVFHIFEPSPPSLDTTQTEAVRSRVVTIAQKFLDPDVFLGGENAAIAEYAILALAALRDSRLATVLVEAKNLGRTWLNHQLRINLGELLHSWGAIPMVRSHPAYEMVSAQLASIP